MTLLPGANYTTHNGKGYYPVGHIHPNQFPAAALKHSIGSHDRQHYKNVERHNV